MDCGFCGNAMKMSVYDNKYVCRECDSTFYNSRAKIVQYPPQWIDPDDEFIHVGEFSDLRIEDTFLPLGNRESVIYDIDDEDDYWTDKYTNLQLFKFFKGIIIDFLL